MQLMQLHQIMKPLIQQSINKMTDEKGKKMQNKWLRIAAGAFNAAQKGSPTLLGGTC